MSFFIHVYSTIGDWLNCGMKFNIIGL